MYIFTNYLPLDLIRQNTPEYISNVMLNLCRMLDIIQSPLKCAVEVITCLRTNLFKHVLLLDPALMLACLRKPHI